MKTWEQRDDVEYVESDHRIYPLSVVESEYEGYEESESEEYEYEIPGAGLTHDDDNDNDQDYYSTPYIPYGIESVRALSLGDNIVYNQKVCIIDSGYDVTHPNLQSSKGRVTGHTQARPSLWTTDESGHGTHVAGTINAIRLQGGQGLIGVIRDGPLKLHIVKVFGENGWTKTSDLIRAVEHCAAVGANIVNMSLGTSHYSKTHDDAMARIYNQGVLLVAAAGNNGSPSKFYPASYPSVMSVAAIDSNNKKAVFSQYNNQVNIAAPGVDVWSTVPGGRYGKKSGTSMASPHVAGVAALVWSSFPDETAQRIRQVLESTAQDLGSPGIDDEYGHGLVRADLAYSFLFLCGDGVCETDRGEGCGLCPSDCSFPTNCNVISNDKSGDDESSSRFAFGIVFDAVIGSSDLYFYELDIDLLKNTTARVYMNNEPYDVDSDDSLRNWTKVFDGFVTKGQNIRFQTGFLAEYFTAVSFYISFDEARSFVYTKDAAAPFSNDDITVQSGDVLRKQTGNKLPSKPIPSASFTGHAFVGAIRYDYR